MGTVLAPTTGLGNTVVYMYHMARKDALLGELTLARGETLRIGPQDVSTELQPTEELELGDYGNFIHAIYFHITTREDIVRDIEEVRLAMYMITTLDVSPVVQALVSRCTI